MTHDGRRTTDIERSQKLTMSTSCSGELKSTKHYEQFLLFPQCFQKTCTTETQKPGLVWKRGKSQLKHSPTTNKEVPTEIVEIMKSEASCLRTVPGGQCLEKLFMTDKAKNYNL